MLSLRAFACAALCTQLASAWSIGSRSQKRDDSAFVPERVNVPLRYDTLGRYVTYVTMVSLCPYGIMAGLLNISLIRTLAQTSRNSILRSQPLPL
jgi:hypothetical protein